MERLSKFYKQLIYVLPFCLIFSYYPIISFGSNETMNFELSLPVLWLVVFDALAFAMMIKEGVLFKGLKDVRIYLLFLVWAAVSLFWSLNVTRGVLTFGVLGLMGFAIYGIWVFRRKLNIDFWRKFLNSLFLSTILVCGWCVLQCVLDLMGVSQNYTLMCPGCTYKMFGFPHPNGFAIEPQFMGNLLLAPLLIIIYVWMMNNANKKFFKALLIFVFSSALFLTFSRGAIYAEIVGIIFLSTMMVFKDKDKRKEVGKRVAGVWGIVILAFLFTLNLQGIMAQLSPTNDTYFSGVNKVLNHLSLGIIDFMGVREDMGRDGLELDENTERELESVGVNKAVEEAESEMLIVGAGELLAVENSVENFGIEVEDEADDEAIFDGYVAESTETRLRLTGAAVTIWKQDFKTILFGVGLGGAGMALYNNNLSPVPKEIVQNQYASLLLETGLIGVSLFVLMVIFAIRFIIKQNGAGVILALLLSYGISLCFFSGLPNALHIYLMIGLMIVFGEKSSRVFCERN